MFVELCLEYFLASLGLSSDLSPKSFLDPFLQSGLLVGLLSLS